jgi:hypothetical protein
MLPMQRSGSFGYYAKIVKDKFEAAIQINISKKNVGLYSKFYQSHKNT